jgi:hypothetical protein
MFITYHYVDKGLKIHKQYLIHKRACNDNYTKNYTKYEYTLSHLRIYPKI